MAEYLTPDLWKASTLSARGYCALAYNALQALGWASCALALAHAGFAALGTGDPRWAYAAAGPTVVHLQYLAMSEIVLCLAGVIPSSLLTVAAQLTVRNVVILVVTARHASLQAHPSVALFLLAWTVIECLRFPWLLCKTLGEPPVLLSYLRYALPLVLYPMGGVGEAWTMWRAMGALSDADVFFTVGGVSVTLGLLIVSMSFDFCEPEVAHTYYKVVCVGSPVSPVFPCNSLRVRA